MDNDRDLILRSRSGDKEAFGELVRRYQVRIFAAAYRLLRNYEDAAELTQDAFVLAYQAIKGFRLRSSFFTWIYRITLNLCYHRLRSSQHKIKLRTKPLEGPFISSQPLPSQIAISKEQEEFVRQALVSLKPRFYEVVVLRDLEGLSYKEIAVIQNCSLGTVMSRLHRARLQLAEILKKMGINLS